MPYSHRTQELLNYFDEKDTRVREIPYTIDAQLLNTVALQIDDHERRVQREIASRALRTTPVHIDNSGIYYGAKVPNSFVLPEIGAGDPLIEGNTGSAWVTLSPYDDFLPVPAGVSRNSSLDVVALSNPLICDLSGNGLVQTVSPGVLPLGNVLTFWLDGMTTGSVVEVLVSGQRFPQPAWVNERKRSSEIVRSLDNGVFYTRFPWARVDQITVRGLVSGTRLRGWVLPVSLPYVLDPDRPYSDPGYRDKLFPRYVSVASKQLTFSYFSGNFGGMEYVESYSFPDTLVGCAPEPFTWGMYVCSGNKLYYVDRRSPVPDNLKETGLSQEPVYGISVRYNPERSIGSTHYVSITPVPYGYSAQGAQHRYVVEAPDGNPYVLTPDGALTVYSPGAGWRLGIPTAVQVPLFQTGSYMFSIECRDGSGNLTRDLFPYYRGSMSSVTTFDVSGLVSTIKGIAFDHLSRLWAWDGNFAVPLKPYYNGYVIDRDTNTVYATDSFTQIRLT